MNAFLIAHEINLRTLGVANCDFNAGPDACNGTLLPTAQLDAPVVGRFLQVFFGVIGIVTVIYIVIAGFQLVTSQGDSQSIAKARQTIIYACVGLAIVVLAEAIISVVLGRL